MFSFYRNLNLFWRVSLPIILIFPVAIAIQINMLKKSSLENTTKAAEETALNTIKQYKAIRGYYTNKVVNKINSSDNNKLKFGIDHDGVKGVLPLPATFIQDLSATFAKSDDGIRLRLYSDLPFPNRASRVLDDFQKDALAYLKENPEKTYRQTIMENGKEHVRVAIADKLVAQGCVNCHNNHPDTPFKNWKLNDVRGILEVETPISGQVAANASMIENISILSVLFNLVALFITIFIVLNLSKRIIELSKRLKVASSKAHDNSIHLDSLTSGLADQTQKQASAVQETVASLDEINSMVQNTAESVGKLNEFANTSQTKAEEGQKAIQAVVTSMNQIDSNGSNILSEVEENNKELKDIIAIINEVEDKTKVINDIVFQTKLLSFNASVEAARAGEDGKGFAVVAEEVGNLASISGKAAGEISEILDKSAKTVNDIVERTRSRMISLVESGQKSIQEGVGITNRCAEIFSELSGYVVNMKERMEDLSLAAKEQSAGVNGISEAMNEINDVAAHFDSSSLELKELSASLTGQSSNLEGYVKTLETIAIGNKNKAHNRSSQDEDFEHESNTEQNVDNVVRLGDPPMKMTQNTIKGFKFS
ncbi:MAG: methyl-accepting chemotaxis protein [Bdellovibrionota bacterium]